MCPGALALHASEGGARAGVAERRWTPADRARFEASVERIRAEALKAPDPFVECGHCPDVLRRLFDTVLACPGCGAEVCQRCHDRRGLFVNQSCRKQG
jgi:predicted RNA-binding Zn-ribbon protein involved in translation (DUF1610 family)